MPSHHHPADDQSPPPSDHDNHDAAFLFAFLNAALDRLTRDHQTLTQKNAPLGAMIKHLAGLETVVKSFKTKKQDSLKAALQQIDAYTRNKRALDHLILAMETVPLPRSVKDIYSILPDQLHLFDQTSMQNIAKTLRQIRAPLRQLMVEQAESLDVLPKLLMLLPSDGRLVKGGSPLAETHGRHLAHALKHQSKGICSDTMRPLLKQL